MPELKDLTVKQLTARGLAAWETEDYEAALSDFAEILKRNPRFPDIHNKSGLCHAMLGDLEAALESFNSALEINEAYAEAHLNRAIVLNDLGRFEEARGSLERADTLDHSDENAFPSDVGNRIANAHAELGDLYMAANHPAEAADQYQKAVEVRPRYLDIRNKLAEALLDIGELDRARTELEYILQQRPGFHTARLRYGVVLQRLGEDQSALKEFKRCQEEDPNDLRARAYIASISGEAA